MASIWKHPKSRYWTACFRDVNGHQRRASTKETNKKRAQRIADEYEKASRSKRTPFCEIRLGTMNEIKKITKCELNGPEKTGLP